MAGEKARLQNSEEGDQSSILREILKKKGKSGITPEDYAELAAIESLRDGLLGKDANPKVFLPLVQFLHKKYKDYKTIASKIGGKMDDHTVQQWFRVSEAAEHEPEIYRYLSERPTNRTLTVSKAYRIISKFGDAYVSLKVIELMAGLGDREIAEILQYYEKNPRLSIRECKEHVIRRT